VVRVGVRVQGGWTVVRIQEKEPPHAFNPMGLPFNVKK